MERNKLINKIITSFKSVKLEDGIGLWEASGHDDRLTAKECKKLRLKDEKNDWSKIPVLDLYKCSSSLSFFDAKGMRFHLAVFLLLALGYFEKEEEELIKKGEELSYLAPDVEFHLISVTKYVNPKNDMDKRMYEYNQERFSLINSEQKDCIKEFILFRMTEMEKYYKDYYAKEFNTAPSAVKYDKKYIELEKALEYWG